MTARNSTTDDEQSKPKLVDRLGRPVKHGMYATPEYSAWQHMLDRCYNPNSQRFDRYGARGIRVCERWKNSFEEFFADMGRRPTGEFSLDRKDNDGDYEVGNCRWATRAEQNANKSDNVFLEYDGRRQTIAEWSRETGIGQKTLSLRLECGWAVEDALTRPVAPRRWRGKPGERRDGVPPESGDRRYLGVGWDKTHCYWVAYVGIDKYRRIYVGTFDTAIDGALARDEMALELFGERANLNFTQSEREEVQEAVDREARDALRRPPAPEGIPPLRRADDGTFKAPEPKPYRPRPEGGGTR